MAFDEEVQVRMGLDRRPFDKALKGAQGAMGTFKGALGALGVGFSLGAAKSFIGSILEMGDGLKRQSEALQVSTDFLQGWSVAAAENGSDAGEATKALDKFSNHLSDTGRIGADVEEEIGKLADRIAAAKTPVERIGIASEAFGSKLGAKLIPALQGGSKALGEFIANAKKLSTDDIERLDAIGDALGAMERDAKVLSGGALISVGKFGASLLTAIGLNAKFGSSLGGIGKTTALIANIASAIDSTGASTKKTLDEQARAEGRRLEIKSAYAKVDREIADTEFQSLSTEEQLGQLVEERKELLDQIAEEDASVESAKKLIEVEKLSQDINERQKKIDEDRLKTAKDHVNAIAAQGNAQLAVEKARASFDAAKQDRSGLTLQELANATPQTRAGARNVNAARQVIGAEDFAQRARIEGRTDLAKKATDFALGLRKQIEPLTTSEKNPLASMDAGIAEANETLTALLDKASKDGLVIQPRNGK